MYIHIFIYLHTYVHTYMHMYRHRCTHARTHTRTHARTHTCMPASTRVPAIRVPIDADLRECVCTCARERVCLYIYVYIDTYVYIYIYTHTYIHAYVCICICICIYICRYRHRYVREYVYRCVQSPDIDIGVNNPPPPLYFCIPTHGGTRRRSSHTQGLNPKPKAHTLHTHKHKTIPRCRQIKKLAKAPEWRGLLL